MQIGIDLGATKIESVLLDEKGKELLRERNNSPQDYPNTLTSIKNIVNKIEKKFAKKLMLVFVTRDPYLVIQGCLKMQIIHLG